MIQLVVWLRSWVTRLHIKGGKPSLYDHLIEDGFKPVFGMGLEGEFVARSDRVGWFVKMDNRHWLFSLDSLGFEPQDFTKALFISVHRPGLMVIQCVIANVQSCRISGNDDLILQSTSAIEVLDLLTPWPDWWSLAAKHMGLGAIDGWATA